MVSRCGDGDAGCCKLISLRGEGDADCRGDRWVTEVHSVAVDDDGDETRLELRMGGAGGGLDRTVRNRASDVTSGCCGCGGGVGLSSIAFTSGVDAIGARALTSSKTASLW